MRREMFYTNARVTKCILVYRVHIQLHASVRTFMRHAQKVGVALNTSVHCGRRIGTSTFTISEAKMIVGLATAIGNQGSCPQ